VFTRGGTEELLPQFNRATQEFRTQMAYPPFKSSYIEADAGTAVGAACFLYSLEGWQQGGGGRGGEDGRSDATAAYFLPTQLTNFCPPPRSSPSINGAEKLDAGMAMQIV